MNQHLQKIRDFIEQSETLSAEEKAALAKTVKSIDTDFSITEFKLDRTEKVKRTTAILLEETIEELEQKRKAVEYKNRDLEIEASLERMRTVAMGMRKPDDLLNICKALFNELQLLQFDNLRNVIIHTYIDEKNYFIDYDYSDFTKGHISHIPYSGNLILEKFVKDIRKTRHAFAEMEITGDNLKEWQAFRDTNNEVPDERLSNTTSLYYYIYAVGEAAIGISTFVSMPAEKLEVLKCFRNVFDLAYRRYTDITKAEAQAREAQIEASLERVRARTMAMQHSTELQDAALILFQQVEALGVRSWSSGFNIFDADKKTCTAWHCSAGLMMPPFFTPLTEDPTYIHFYEGSLTGEPLFAEQVEGAALIAHYQYLRTLPGLREMFAALSEGGFEAPARQINHAAYFTYGYLLFITFEPVPEAHDIFRRFASVFEQTYTRFLDLQKAEAQAREAKIEAALERVRGRTMAMYRSEELAETAVVLFQQLGILGIAPDRVFIGIFMEDTGEMECWATDQGGNQIGNRFIAKLNQPSFAKIHKSWKAQEKSLFLVQTGKELEDYINYFRDDLGLAFKAVPMPDKRVQNVAFFSNGLIGFTTADEQPPAIINLMERFAGVFNQTYTRFLDLQKAEAQAREAVKQASLDRVRGEIASMRTANDLERITPLVWNELTILGIPFIRCGVFIMDEYAELIHTHLSTPHGKAIAAFAMPFDAEGIGRDLLPAWRKKQMAVVHWSAEEFAAYTKTLVAQGAVKSKGKYVTERPDTTLDLHFFPFLQGMLYAGNTEPLTNDEKDLVQSLADAFSTAYARYEDFNKLEAAKQQVENTLTDLKAAQTKLIQSEKMASLGELTAGIAHEIQNPLNFVNNFSEVNQEMIDELAEELKAGNIDGALAIAADIKQNEEKINHHGKRADGIVKGMLQHSRSNAGEKQLANLNAIADEFFKLSYHGLRAKDKTFNAELITNFDDSLPKINAIPQDIGRVMLNLFNNAFYAVNQKAKTAGPDYKPTVSVTTSSENGQVMIKVKDNGIGIPGAIKDKIMQPFFTTKPTGEGTGLGLSLTYDMVVKGHGGKVEVKSIENEYTEFTISLPMKKL